MDTRYYSGTPLISIVYSWSMKIWLCLPDGHNQHFFLGRSLKFGAFFLFVLPSSVRNGLQSEWKNILIVVSFISSKLKKVTLVCQINIFSLSSYPESDLYLWMAWINNLLCNWSVNCWRSCCCRCRRCQSSLLFTKPYNRSGTEISRCKLEWSCCGRPKRFPESSVVPSFLVRKVENESFHWSHNLGERTG